MSLLLSLPTSITCHAWNKNLTKIALCSNNEQVQIYAIDTKTTSFSLESVLNGHDKLVTDVDWAPETNRIVSCSQDRNALVWSLLSSGEWTPILVLLRINRAATAVRWSPDETKFAVASGARCISICHFEEENNWWVSKHLKKPIKSTVLSINWHPNNVLLSAGAADMKTRVFSAFIKGLDGKPGSNPWGDKLPFNTICAEITNGFGGWVHDVAFSPSGNVLAWVGHDSSLCLYYPAETINLTVKTPYLPFLSLLWIDENTLVAAGHDCFPVLFKGSSKGWKLVDKVDSGCQQKAAAGSVALNMFRQLDTRGQTHQTDSDLSSLHQNSIRGMRMHSKIGERVTKFSTCGVDGKIVLWDLKNIESSMSGLSLHN